MQRAFIVPPGSIRLAFTGHTTSLSAGPATSNRYALGIICFGTKNKSFQVTTCPEDFLVLAEEQRLSFYLQWS